MNELMRRLLHLPEQASEMAPRLDALHYFEFVVMNAIGLVLGVAGIWFLFRYRRRSESQRTPRIVYPLWLETGFVVTLLGLFLAWFFLGYRQYLAMTLPREGTVEVYVTAKQWMWKFAHVDGPSEVGVLTVPVGQPVKLILTSRDVIHSFFVPEFRVKRDAVPGRYTTVWFEAARPGRHQVFCTEYCGTGHSKMLAEVIALEPAAYDDWLAGQRETGTTTMVDEGRAAAVRHGCLRCHSVDGTRDLGPTWLGLYGKLEDLQGGARVLVDEAYITQSMMDPAAKIVAGYPPVMPSYQGITAPAEAAAIIEYIKSLHGGGGEAPSAAEAGGGGAGGR